MEPPISTSTATSTIKIVSDLSRFTEPIPSFPGKAPTQKELDIIKRITQFLENK